MSRRVLVIDDEQGIRAALTQLLEYEGYEVRAAASGTEGLTVYDQWKPQLAFLDVKMAGMDGIETLKRLRERDPSAVVVMISGHATIQNAVEATQLGAYDILEKPLDTDRILVTLRNATGRIDLAEENERLKATIESRYEIVGKSFAIRSLIEKIERVADTTARVLITGENGTGKELVARALHRQSARARKPFVEVNCAAIPGELIESELFGHEKGSFTGATVQRRGKFELADGGTLFLDEIGDLHTNSQAKLLRVLQEGEFHRVGGEQSIRVTVRVISATNRDLQALVAQEKFREDLYYRVSVVPIRVPALRERPQDVRPMAEYFLEDFCVRNGFRRKSFHAEVWEAFENFRWPGNARELRNTVERMAILSHEDVLTAAAVPYELRLQREAGGPTSVQEARESAEREHVLRALEESGWNVSGAARALGMERTNLHKRIRALGLSRGK